MAQLSGKPNTMQTENTAERAPVMKKYSVFTPSLHLEILSLNV